MPASVDATEALLRGQRYLADRTLSVVTFLALKLGRPLFLEGEAGVGKTEVARALAAGLGRDLIRLQCYEGLDASSALYEWNHLRQLLELRVAEVTTSADRSRSALTSAVFSPEFLIKRPLLQALEPNAKGPPVLLIDEIDRADEPFEAFLLEILADYQVTIPELGTVRAAQPPIVVLTSNRTREVHDALKRRCLYHWVGYPDAARELQILAARAPEAGDALAQEIVQFVQGLRQRRLQKPPGVAESIEWARAIVALGQHALTPQLLHETLGVLLKYEEDISAVRANPPSISAA
ncbi:MAG TPA: MoxR family ATPase [Steroidobacteraceae bacterium]|mgnify:FL=1|nr:MoxR family ATPase [Steroidobacteraceae bacterium]